MDRPHQEQTHQLLHGSALLLRPSTLKFVNILLALEASLRLALGPTPTNNEVMLYRKGGHNRERNCRIPHIDFICETISYYVIHFQMAKAHECPLAAVYTGVSGQA